MIVNLLKQRLKKEYIIVLALVLLAPVSLFISQAVYADELTNRSVSVSSSRPSENANHSYSFNIISSSPIGSIVFEYCSNSPLFSVPCVAPAGLDASAAALTSQSGETGFVVNSSINNRVILSRASIASTPQSSMYELSNIINPSSAQTTFFVRVSTHASIDGTGASVDRGSVAFSTAGSLSTTLFVPPYLTFCVGVSVGVDCSTATGNALNLGVLTHFSAALGSSQFAGATNDSTGYTVNVLGLTMTSGNNTIPAASTPTPSNVGVSQFGINLKQNTIPVGGQDPSGAGTAIPVNGYGLTNSYKFVQGDVIAHSPLSTNFNLFTVSYLVNVSENQPPGIYVATITYVATASF